MSDSVRRAAEAVAACRTLLITAGAGMGVDSGLPDFRGPEGFWRAYPPMQQLGLHFEEMSCPRWFGEDPTLAWGFFGHRLQLYRNALPHAGFEILRAWTTGRSHFIFTSNVDGQFQKAGFDPLRVMECHGSIHHLQCVNRHCSPDIWSSDGVEITLDEPTMRAQGDLPHCPRCHRIARPNILMFGDAGWLSTRTKGQEARLLGWYDKIEGPLVVIELGAGQAIPTVRAFSEQFSRRSGGTLIRVNPREAEGPAGTISIRLGAREALASIHKALLRPQR